MFRLAISLFPIFIVVISQQSFGLSLRTEKNLEQLQVVNGVSGNDVGFLPPTNSNAQSQSSTRACSCKQLLVSSLGQAQHVQPSKLK